MPRPSRQRLFHLLDRFRQGLHHGLRVPLIGSLYRHRDNRSGLQIHCMLRLVRQVRPPVLHSGNPRIRIMRVLPNPVRSFARALAVQFGQIFPSRRLNPGGFRQLHQKLFIPLLAVPAHDAAQRCIRFQRSGIDADRLAPQQAARPDPLQYPVKDCFVGSHIDQSSGSGDRGVIRRRLAQFQSQKLSQCQRISCSPGYSSFRSDPFEIPHQQQPKVHSRSQARSPHLVCIELRTQSLHEVVKAVFVEKAIQSFVEAMAGGAGQLTGGDPQVFLLSTFLFPHCHGVSLVSLCDPLSSTFTTGC